VFPPLFDVSDLNRLTDGDGAAIGLFLSGNHAEQGGFTRAVTADNTDDGSLGYRERQIVDQQTALESLVDVFQSDDLITQARARRDVDLVGFVTALKFLGL